MLNRRFFLIIGSLPILSLLQKPLTAQTVESIKANRLTYLWGEGNGITIKAADQAALAEIIGQISTQVESNFERTVTETDNKFKEMVNGMVKTYSNATLNNTERMVLQDEPDAIVFRYVKRSEIARIFESRKNKLIELAHSGETALKNLQIADALRYFYWSQTLLRSHPEAGIKMLSESGSEELLVTWLPVQINQIFTDLSFRVDSIENNEGYSNYILDIQYKNEPVRNLDYTYWSGQDWSNIVSAKDGMGIVELSKSENSATIRLKAEYSFEGEANIDLELRDVMQKLPQVPYKDSYITISKTVTPKPESKVQKETAKPANSVGSIHPLVDMGKNDSIMKRVIAAITSKNYSKVQPFFTAGGYSVFQSLLQYGNARILRLPDLKYFQYGDYTICRSIPMSFNFKTNNRTFIEEVVFYFDKENKICNITFSLSDKSIEDIALNDTWSPENRLLLICFLENYKTAFALKRYDYISNIFSDDALIITGYVTRVNNSPDSRYAKNEIVRYNRQTKTEYLKRLRYSFAGNEFINLRFADNTIRRSGKGNDVYGIQIKQDYFSTNYGDSGYLFLLVDLSDTLTPQIHVRTWQPEKNPDGSIYGLSDF
ncbi:MAG: hypothetical protein WCS03_08695 [Bacteroidota bacterium]